MFTVINKSNKDNYQKQLRFFKKTYTKEVGVEINDLSFDNGGTYFIGENKEHGVIGGALMMPIEQLKHLNGYLCTQGYEISNHSVITDVFFHLPSTSSIHEDEEAFNQLVTQFYKKLYKKIASFSKERNHEILLTYTPLEEHEDIKYFGSWPFTLQHRVSSSREIDRVFGILAVKES